MDVTAQWADSLLALERLYFLKLVLWGAASVIAGTMIRAVTAVKGRSAPMLRALAHSLAALGVAELGAALPLRAGAGLRDLGSATTLDRALWLVSGLVLGWAVVAFLAALRAARRRPASDARAAGLAIGVGLHGVAIAILTLQLARAIVR